MAKFLGGTLREGVTAQLNARSKYLKSVNSINTNGWDYPNQ